MMIMITSAIDNVSDSEVDRRNDNNMNAVINDDKTKPHVKAGKSCFNSSLRQTINEQQSPR